MADTHKNKEEIICCGLVMPISAIDGCDESHWLDVKEILTEIVEDAGLRANLVSYADEAGIIQKRIIHNLYENPIVICDVSGKNPNVMFELGMRLAFDKPTIVIKDDVTSYSFDTSPIEHITYPRDLRFTKIVEFKKGLKDKILATLHKAETDPDYTSFLKHFGTFKIAHIDTTEVSQDVYILEELKEIRRSVAKLQNAHGSPATMRAYSAKFTPSKNLEKLIKDGLQNLITTNNKNDLSESKIREYLYSYVLCSDEFQSLPLDESSKSSLLEKAINQFMIEYKFLL